MGREVRCAVIVNSIVSEDDRENRQMLRSCTQALRPGGLLAGFFPTVFANLDIGHLDENAEWLRRSDLPTNTFYEAAHDATQIFYTDLLDAAAATACAPRSWGETPDPRNLLL